MQNNTARQKRQSCEACRTRKLKCSGYTGERRSCTRCLTLNVVCHYQDKGIPGRPRKQRRPESREGERGETREDEHRELRHLAFAPSPPVTDSSSTGSIDGSNDDRQTTSTSSHQSQSQHRLGGGSSPASISCHCADDVSASVRALRHRAQAVSHAIVGDLRVGTDLVERLLTCPICYDIKKAPRLTIENVLLIGRLMHEVTTGYRRYLRWVGSDTNGEGGSRQDSVSVGGVEFEINRHMVHKVVRQGLQADAARLTDLGGRFALRQHNRHMVGHETCPDPDGRCWRERYDMDTDPLDICPQNAAARTLTPCYRVVDAICLGIKAFADDVGQPDTQALQAQQTQQASRVIGVGGQ
ncbi:hypothetical protein Sste5344_000962 [Sporothrix stenoceras]